MIKVTITYPNKTGCFFDADYYLNEHMPQAIECLGESLLGVTVEQGISGAVSGSPPAYVAICHLFFESVEAFLKAYMPHMKALQADVANYTNIGPVTQYSEVKIHQ